VVILGHAQHHRLLRRVVAEADGIDGLLDEQRMRGQRETVTQVWFEIELTPGLASRRFRPPLRLTIEARDCAS
jgi:hypothetical protein